jgi:hypothetical protein
MTLSELLTAACITILVVGAALAAITPLQRSFAAQPEAASLAQRTRVVAERLSADLRRASLVLPLRYGAVDNDIPRGVFHRDDVVTTLSDPIAALASGAVVPSESRTYHLKLDGEGVWQLMQYDGLASDQPAVEDVITLRFEYFGSGEPPTASVTPRGDVRVTYGAPPPLPAVDDPGDTWGAGENCTIANAGGQYVPRLANLGGGVVSIGPALLQDGPWCPDAAHAFRFDADLLRVRRVRVHVRLQAARPFRGLLGAWFANGGTAGDPWRYVPDEDVTLEVMPRNVHVAR